VAVAIARTHGPLGGADSEPQGVTEELADQLAQRARGGGLNGTLGRDDPVELGRVLERVIELTGLGEADAGVHQDVHARGRQVLVEVWGARSGRRGLDLGHGSVS
jgi:hypothetical protein